MEQQSYYRILNDRDNDFDLPNCYLAVNCTGFSKTNRPFRTVNQRGRRDFYLQYCVEGEIFACVNGRRQTLLPGQLGIWAPGSPYEISSIRSDTAYYWIHFTGTEAERLLNRCGLACNTVFSFSGSDRISRLFQDLFREFLWRDGCFEDSCIAYLLRILTEFSRMRDFGSPRGNPSLRQIQTSLSYFHNHMNQPLTVMELAKIEHFSPSRYRAVFRRCMGISPSEYMTKMRIRHACELLAMENMSVREVSEACGYTDPLYFSRVFRSQIGVSPSKYVCEV